LPTVLDFERANDSGQKKRLGPVGLGGLNTRQTTALFGIVKAAEGSGWAPLTAWQNDLIMTNAVALNATGAKHPASSLSSARRSVIFSSESDTGFDAVTQRYGGELHFIWNWYY
jgi:hypothetical protein